MTAVIGTLFILVIFGTIWPAIATTFGLIDSIGRFGLIRGFKIFIRDNNVLSITGALFYVSVILAWVIYNEMTHGIQW